MQSSERRISLLAFVLAVLALAPSCRAAPVPSCEDSLRNAVHVYQQMPPGDQKRIYAGALLKMLTFNENAPCLVGAILSTSADAQASLRKPVIERLKAMFQQNGSSQGSGGSTNAVSKGTVANILSIASEYGALTESASGQTVTIQGTLAGIPTLLEHANALEPCSPAIHLGNCLSSHVVSNLQRFSYSVTFAASQASPQISASGSGSNSSSMPLTFTANYHSIDSASAKVVFVKGASATPDVVGAAIAALTNGKTLPINTLAQARQKLQSDFPDFATASMPWQKNELDTLEKADDATVATEWSSLGDNLIKTLCSQSGRPCALQDDTAAFAQAYLDYLQQEQTFFDSLRKAPLLTGEYDLNTPASQPSNSTVRLIGAMPATSGLAFTLNAAGSWYNSTPSASIPGSRRLRDLQFAAEAAYTFSGPAVNLLGQSTASVAYYYQDQTSPAILNVTPGQPVSGVTFTDLPSNASQVFAERGVINLGQGKFTFIPGKLGINIPVSVTWSNRTELVTHSVWRGQIGISYDLDSLFSGTSK